MSGGDDSSGGSPVATFTADLSEIPRTGWSARACHRNEQGGATDSPIPPRLLSIETAPAATPRQVVQPLAFA